VSIAISWSSETVVKWRPFRKELAPHPPPPPDPLLAYCQEIESGVQVLQGVVTEMIAYLTDEDGADLDGIDKAPRRAR
jgi:hypothetical protein